jgi:hypothetical protein
MKRSEIVAQKSSMALPILEDMHFVHRDGPSVRIRRYVIETGRGVRHVAELSAHEAGVERAVIDAASSDELGAMIEPAARAFALSVRFRNRFTRAVRP